MAISVAFGAWKLLNKNWRAAKIGLDKTVVLRKRGKVIRGEEAHVLVYM